MTYLNQWSDSPGYGPPPNDPRAGRIIHIASNSDDWREVTYLSGPYAGYVRVKDENGSLYVMLDHLHPADRQWLVLPLAE